MIKLENVARKERALKEVPLGGQRITGAGFPYFAPKEVPLGDTSFHTGYACYRFHAAADGCAGVFGNDDDGDYWFGDLVR